MRRSDDHPGPVARTRRIAMLRTVAILTIALVTGGIVALPASAVQAHSPVSVAVDCEAGAAVVTAPDDLEYSVRVAVVSISPGGSATRSRSVGPLAGNSTVEFDGNGTVFALVLDPSTGETIARSMARCPPADAAETADANATAADGPSVSIDCNDSSVHVVAPPDLEYDLQVTTVGVTATGTNTATERGGPNAGDTTVGFEGNGTVAAFVLDASTGEVLAETVVDCPQTGRTTTADG